ncbi:MAG: FAD-dependent oxidoreductase, partial [Planctomycetia bacterium]
MAASPETAVVVVGAGIAGLVAAGELARCGRRVVVLEKSRGVGGRMATRRVGAAVCDHGAQFFTVRDDGFGSLVAKAREAAVVAAWCDG